MKIEVTDWEAAAKVTQATADGTTNPEVKVLAEQLVAVIGCCAQLTKECDRLQQELWAIETRASQSMRTIGRIG
jgi:hypothetical protein